MTRSARSWITHSPRAGRTRAGFTLPEVIIALLIFAITVSGVCKLIVAARESSDRARDHYIAINMARNRLERARTFVFGQLPQLAEMQTPVAEDGQQTSNTTSPFRRTTVVSNLSANLIEMTVTVEIRNRRTRLFDGRTEAANSMYADM